MYGKPIKNKQLGLNLERLETQAGPHSQPEDTACGSCHCKKILQKRLNSGLLGHLN